MSESKPATLPAAAAAFEKLQGPLVPVITPFDDDERLDLDSLKRWVGNLVDRHERIFWTTHGTSHYMCLSDDEVVALNRAVAEVTRGRAAFIASTPYHWSVARCVEFIKAAQDWGVDVVKLQIDWRAFTPSDDQVVEHYTRIADASPLPLLAYTWGKPAVRPPLLRRILAIPTFIGLKNDTGDFYEQVEYLRVIADAGAANRFTPITGGTMESFLHGYAFGARCFATGTGMFAPEEVKAFYTHLKAGHVPDAVAVIKEYEHGLHGAFVPMGHWSCFHSVLHQQGHFKSPRVRFPVKTLAAEEQVKVAALLRAKNLLQ